MKHSHLIQTLDPKRRTSEELDGICTENILQDVVDVEEIRKNVEKMNQGKFIFNKFCVWSYNHVLLVLLYIIINYFNFRKSGG